MGFERIFIVGPGHVGGKLAHAWRTRGATVQALARSEASAQRLQDQGITPVTGDLDDIWSLRRLDLRGQLLYYLAPPPSSGVNDLRMRTFVNAIKAGNEPDKAVLISTTGVYGDCGGAWIDESAPLNPQTDRARRRVDAENVFRIWARGCAAPAVVLRVAGIYGPGRLPVQRLQRGEPLLREQECPFSNRIHVDDLVNICVAAADKGHDQQVYNVSDGHPSTMTSYFNSVADAVGLPRPPTISLAQAQQQLSPGMLSYMAESRRLRNGKVLKELQVELQYPDLATGLAAMTRK